MIRKGLSRKVIFGHNEMRKLGVSDLEEELLNFKAKGQVVTHIFSTDFHSCLQTVPKKNNKSEYFVSFKDQ